MDENDMSDMIKNISKMINDGNIPDEIKNIVDNLKSDNSSSVNNSTSSSNIAFETNKYNCLKNIFLYIHHSFQ